MKYTWGIIIVLLGLYYGSSVSAGIYTNQMYCYMQADTIQISLKKDNNFLCHEYIDAVQSILKKITHDLLFVQSYISRGEDVAYWISIREILRERFLYVDAIRKNIEYTVALFERNIYIKYKIFLQSTLQDYYAQLLYHRDNGSISNTSFLLKQINEQIDVIQDIWQAEDFDSLIPLAQRYLYLRKEIGGKLAL